MYLRVFNLCVCVWGGGSFGTILFMSNVRCCGGFDSVKRSLIRFYQTVSIKSNNPCI